MPETPSLAMKWMATLLVYQPFPFAMAEMVPLMVGAMLSIFIAYDFTVSTLSALSTAR
jgi:hypothetical protein